MAAASVRSRPPTVRRRAPSAYAPLLVLAARDARHGAARLRAGVLLVARAGEGLAGRSLDQGRTVLLLGVVVVILVVLVLGLLGLLGRIGGDVLEGELLLGALASH